MNNVMNNVTHNINTIFLDGTYQSINLIPDYNSSIWFSNILKMHTSYIIANSQRVISNNRHYRENGVPIPYQKTTSITRNIMHQRYSLLANIGDIHFIRPNAILIDCCDGIVIAGKDYVDDRAYYNNILHDILRNSPMNIGMNNLVSTSFRTAMNAHRFDMHPIFADRNEPLTITSMEDTVSPRIKNNPLGYHDALKDAPVNVARSSLSPSFLHLIDLNNGSRLMALSPNIHNKKGSNYYNHARKNSISGLLGFFTGSQLQYSVHATQYANTYQCALMHNKKIKLKYQNHRLIGMSIDTLAMAPVENDMSLQDTRRIVIPLAMHAKHGNADFYKTQLGIWISLHDHLYYHDDSNINKNACNITTEYGSIKSLAGNDDYVLTAHNHCIAIYNRKNKKINFIENISYNAKWGKFVDIAYNADGYFIAIFAYQIIIASIEQGNLHISKIHMDEIYGYSLQYHRLLIINGKINIISTIKGTDDMMMPFILYCNVGAQENAKPFPALKRVMKNAYQYDIVNKNVPVNGMLYQAYLLAKDNCSIKIHHIASIVIYAKMQDGKYSAIRAIRHNDKERICSNVKFSAHEAGMEMIIKSKGPFTASHEENP